LPPFVAPGRNLGDDIWAISFDGRRFWNLTNRAERGGRVLSPRFSHEGDRVVWSERVASIGSTWGQWVLRVARFDIRRGVPRLHDVETYKPGSQRLFYESYGFTPDDRGILFGANLEPGQSEDGLDLFVLRLASGELQRLTYAADQMDRFARLSPDGRKIVWASGREIFRRRVAFEGRILSRETPLDLWQMDAGGGELERLTGFNDVFSNHYTGQVMVGTPSWSREGDRLIVPVIPLDDSGPGGLYMLELED
jgi:Tol biopolymer transport system component